MKNICREGNTRHTQNPPLGLLEALRRVRQVTFPESFFEVCTQCRLFRVVTSLPPKRIVLNSSIKSS